MTLKTCLEIGKDCGLETVGEAVLNIDIHAMSIFTYSTMTQEINEIIKERDKLFSETNFTNDSKTEDILTWISIEDDGIDTSDLPL